MALGSLLPFLSLAQLQVDLGFLCPEPPHASSSDPGIREECDHVLFMLQALNNKTDGFLDDVLPGVTLNAGMDCPNGCDCPMNDEEATMHAAYADLRSAMPNMTAVIGGACSGALMAMTNAAHRAEVGGRQHLFVSGSSTAPSAANDTAFPNVVRMSTSEAAITDALADLARQLAWQRVAVLSETLSAWSFESAASFEAAHVARGGQVLLPPANVPLLNRAECTAADDSAARVSARAQLEWLTSVGAKVLFIPIHPSCSRVLFSEIHRSGLLSGTGHAFLTNWLSDSMLYSHDGTVEIDALHGAQGALGIIETSGSGAIHDQYVALWGQHATTAACTGVGSAPLYCDQDGAPATFATYGSQWADAALALALALDALLEARRIGELWNPSAVQAELLRMGSFEGVSGTVRLDPSSGDRLGTFAIQNFQIDYSTEALATDCGASTTGRRRLGVPLSTAVAAWFDVGLAQAAVQSVNLTSPIIFPGGSSDVPYDASRPSAPPPFLSPPPQQPPGWLETAEGRAILSAVIGGPLTLLVLVGSFGWLYVRGRKFRRRYDAAQKERVTDAIAANDRLFFPASMLRYEDFMALGRLRPHEELRHLLCYTDLKDDLVVPSCTVFFSHEWTSLSEPDHTGRQYAVMCAALRQLMSEYGWEAADVRIWVDYASTPQANSETQGLAIKSFTSYAACADAFVAVAPPVIHREKGIECNASTYAKRMWCRAEQLSHYLHHGAANMWIATAEDSIVGAEHVHEGDAATNRHLARQLTRQNTRRLSNSAAFAQILVPSTSLKSLFDQPQGVEATETSARLAPSTSAAWISSFSRVFDGDATVETDKETLVLPLLGLYGELLSEKHLAARSPATLQAFSRTRRASVLEDIQANKDTVFPPQYCIAQGKRVKLETSKHAQVTKAPITRELFGDLILRIEQKVEEDSERGEQTRADLAKWASSRSSTTFLPVANVATHGDGTGDAVEHLPKAAATLAAPSVRAHPALKSAAARDGKKQIHVRAVTVM